MKENATMAMQAPVREIVVTATTAALNTALTENQIQPDKIISVILQPAQQLAIGDYEAKYRVLYRL
jgi:chorismate mutase